MIYKDRFLFRIFSLLIILLSGIIKAQDYSFFPEDIKTTADLFNTGEYSQALEYNISSLERYKKEKDKEGMISIYINIGFLLFSINNLKESVNYIDKAQAELGDDDDPLSHARIHTEYAKNYSRLGMKDQSNLNYDKAIHYAYSIKNEKQKKYMLYYSYVWKRLNFLNQKDSLRVIDRKALAIMPNAITYSKMADEFVNNRVHIDSAEYYLKKAFAAPDKDIVGVRGMILLSSGNLSYVKKDYPKALEYYTESMDIFRRKNFRVLLRTAYDSLSSVYDIMDDSKQSKIYLDKYKRLNDSIKNEKEEAVNIMVNKVVKDEDLRIKKEKNRIYFVIALLTVLTIVFALITRARRIRKQIKKDLTLKRQSIQIETLKKKTDDSFDKVFQMAKEDDPFFLTRFKTLYPEFYDRLIKENPCLTDTDLKMCAYIKMNISNKEISVFRNITVRSVETTKYRLKKKLYLDADMDLSEWIENL